MTSSSSSSSFSISLIISSILSRSLLLSKSLRIDTVSSLESGFFVLTSSSSSVMSTISSSSPSLGSRQQAPKRKPSMQVPRTVPFLL